MQDGVQGGVQDASVLITGTRSIYYTPAVLRKISVAGGGRSGKNFLGVQK